MAVRQAGARLQDHCRFPVCEWSGYLQNLRAVRGTVHDGLVSLISSVLRKDPFTGTIFVFRSRRTERSLPIAFFAFGDAQHGSWELLERRHTSGRGRNIQVNRVGSITTKEESVVARLRGCKTV